MFTGIVEETGTVVSAKHEGKSMQIIISAREVLAGMKIGDSINTNGVCITVVLCGPTDFTVDIMPETFRKTNLSLLSPGNKVNLERALRLGDRLGGHLVTGHVDGTGTILRIHKEENAQLYTIEAPKELLRYIVSKGSVAVDGISLTVVEQRSNSFTVSVISHTQKVTSIGSKRTGDIVNIECDMIGKYLEKLAGKVAHEKSISMDYLIEKGFIS